MTAARLTNGTTLKTLCVGSANKCLTFRVNYARLFEVMRERKPFWNVVFKTRRNPEFTGKHVLASCNRIHTTFPIETKQEDIRTLLDDISGEVTSVLDVSPNLSGGYESRSISLHGESIDISVSRFSSFYQMLGAPLMLVATMTALFVLLREK